MNEYNIYPKQFRNLKIPVQKSTCFFLMPFHSDFDYVYGTIKNELNDFGLICNRVDEIGGSIPIINKIITQIIRSQYIIVDLSRYNPNVFYELGIAHTFKDARNILLIKQKEDKVPFDITHLTYIEYDPNNLKLLTATIKKFIAENKNVSAFYDALNVCGIISIIDENSNQHIEYLQEQLGVDLPIAVDLLNGNSDIAPSNIDALLDNYQKLLYQLMRERNMDAMPLALKVYYEILCKAAGFQETDQYILSFMQAGHEAFEIHEQELLGWKTDLAIALASRAKKLYLVLNWIIGYFSRSKSATIDLNRHKLEGFLLSSSQNAVNEAIIVALHNENCYIREHMADIAGEKHLVEALPTLYAQLAIEDNYFTASSIISAIGKLRDPNGILKINDWIEANWEEINTTKQFFVLRRALMAISLLDKTETQMHINDFQQKYGAILKDYYII